MIFVNQSVIFLTLNTQIMKSNDLFCSTIRVDIDNTIFYTEDTNYSQSKPIFKNIEKINKLYDMGHHIIYWSSRGVGSGIDYRELTIKQLDAAGCKYDSLELNKPLFDIFIDDKAINSETFFSNDNFFSTQSILK
jgi:hypothetical protein